MTRTLSWTETRPRRQGKVAENTEAGENIGAPVRATDDDSDQKLTYTLDETR